MSEEVKKPKVTKATLEKLKKQLETMADFEVEWIKNVVLEEWDKRNFDWVKVVDHSKTKPGDDFMFVNTVHCPKPKVEEELEEIPE